jgi:hypothetical protein
MDGLKIDGVLTGSFINDSGANKSDEFITIPYEQFKNHMGLEDIRFNWLLGKNNYMAGGLVLNWINSEQKNDDVDFYFFNPQAVENFEVLITELCGFKFTHRSNYAQTYYNPDTNTILQIVDGFIEEIQDGIKGERILIGEPKEVLSGFDFGLCRFAVDENNVFTSVYSIRDLLSKSIRLYKVWNSEQTAARIMKYNKKGFYLSKKMLALEETHEWLRRHNLTSSW